MKKILCSIVFIFSLSASCQNNRSINLVNQVLLDNAPSHLKHLYLNKFSLKESLTDSLHRWQEYDLIREDKSFPSNLDTAASMPRISWDTISLQNNIILINEREMQNVISYSSPVRFINQSSNDKRLNRLRKKDPNAIILRNNKFWSSTDRWHAVKRAYKSQGLERIIYSLSTPVFSENGNYARISVYYRRRCKGSESFYIYRKINNKWKKIVGVGTRYEKVAMSHATCSNVQAHYVNKKYYKKSEK